MPTELNQAVSLEDVQRALGDALGSGYKVSTTSDSTLRVHRSGLLGVKVTMTWAEGKTTFSVRPEPGLLVMLFNTLYTAPKVRKALVRAFPVTP